MLIRFRVKNFRSLYEEQELSLIAAPLKESRESVIQLKKPEIGLLRTAGIYGANASGKSTVLEALKFMRDAVIQSQIHWAPNGGVPRQPFLLNSMAKDEPSLFEVEILIEQVRYRYGFLVDSKRVLEEWLYAYPQGRPQQWFVRDSAAKKEFSFSRHLTGKNKAITELTRSNSLFLSAAAQNNHKMLMPIYQWFRYSLEVSTEIIRNLKKPAITSDLENPDIRKVIESLIKTADLGIVDFEAGQEDIPEIQKTLIKAIFPNDETIMEELKVDPTVPKITFKHNCSNNGTTVDIPFEIASKGTQTLFNLGNPIAETLVFGGVLCIDEIDSSLHPQLVIKIIELFNNPESNPNNAQLIFNTHDTNILENGGLRRDQIWFIEKDKLGSSHLYPLTDYHPRKGENIKQGYLQGRYGAVPYLRGMDALLTKSAGEDTDEA